MSDMILLIVVTVAFVALGVFAVVSIAAILVGLSERNHFGGPVNALDRWMTRLSDWAAGK